MTLPPNFQFSQSSLQDYVDCARRFELRYLQQLKWPAVQAEPVAEHERHIRQGAAFHQLVYQHLSGVGAESIARLTLDNPLHDWWENFTQANFVNTLPAARYAEIELTAPFIDSRLIAKYDLIAIEPGQRAIIVDWKTAQRKPKRERLEKMLQTRVYPYLLVQAGKDLNEGAPILPEQIEMVYWFTENPNTPERFVYSTAQYQADGEYLAALAREIQHRSVFELTPNEKTCAFCTYRSLCVRGIHAGNLEQMDETPEMDFDLGFDFDFDQIAEVEF